MLNVLNYLNYSMCLSSSVDGCVHRHGTNGDVCREAEEADPGAHTRGHSGKYDRGRKTSFKFT